MRLTTTIRSFAFAALLAGGCGSLTDASQLGGGAVPLTSYSTKANGTGIHVGSTQPESWFGLAGTSLTWYMTGFARHADGSYWATGWYSADAALLRAEAQVLRAELGGSSSQVQEIRTSGSRLRIALRDASGTVRTLQHAELANLNLVLRVPDQTGLLYSNYRLRFTRAESIDSQFADVDGYQVDYSVDGLLGGSWSSYCKGPSGEAQRSVFFQGSQWSPMDGARTDGADLVTMTCESGSVAKCMRWGYRPWASGSLLSGGTTSLRDYHQACIHLKRASYCGDSRSNTFDGTSIIVNDPFSPAINSGSSDVIEARWSANGATCVSNRRHPELPFLGCPLPLPACSATQSGGFLLTSALPPAGSLPGLTD